MRGYIGKRGAQVHYRTLGEGPALVMLAPTPRSSNYYVTLMPQLAGVTTIAIDTPGFGLSDPIPGDWSMADLAERIAQALDDMGVSRYAVLGIHGGNKIGAALSSAERDKVSRFLFAGMTHSLILSNQDRNRAMRGYYGDAEATIDPVKPVPEEARRAKRWAYVGSAIRKYWNSYDPALAGPGTEADAARVRRHVLDEVMGLDGFDKLYAANFAFDLENTLRTMPAETVVMEMKAPQEDHLERQSDLLVSVMPRARAIALTGTERELVKSRSDVLADAVRRALSLQF